MVIMHRMLLCHIQIVIALCAMTFAAHGQTRANIAHGRKLRTKPVQAVTRWMGRRVAQSREGAHQASAQSQTGPIGRRRG
jgi:hypothetical protein